MMPVNIDLLLQLMGQPNIILVKKGNVRGRRAANARVACRRNAAVFGMGDILDPWVVIVRDDVFRVVRRTVIDHNDFNVSEGL